MAYQCGGINRTVGSREEPMEAVVHQHTTLSGLVDMADRFTAGLEKW